MPLPRDEATGFTIHGPLSFRKAADGKTTCTVIYTVAKYSLTGLGLHFVCVCKKTVHKHAIVFIYTVWKQFRSV